MTSADSPRCENCGQDVTQASLAASAELPPWLRGDYCEACILIAWSVSGRYPNGDALFEPRP